MDGMIHPRRIDDFKACNTENIEIMRGIFIHMARDMVYSDESEVIKMNIQIAVINTSNRRCRMALTNYKEGQQINHDRTCKYVHFLKDSLSYNLFCV